MYRIILSLIGIISVSLLFSCKSVGSDTLVKYANEPDPIPWDRYQYIDVTQVFSLDPQDAKDPIDHRFAVAEKLEDGNIMLHFAQVSNYIPNVMNKLIQFFPKGVVFRILAIPNKNGTYTLMGGKNDKVDKVTNRYVTVSVYNKSDFDTVIGVARHTSGSECSKVNLGPYTTEVDAPVNECFIIEKLCSDNYQNKCGLGWDRANLRYGAPYHIEGIQFK